mmetsp:Transcript_36425/g.68122  ORF Transcript_36425/g.68122 Transcript_36425/m.68122 type:complete len:108 (+) Transcript_36425:489-812(+)
MLRSAREHERCGATMAGGDVMKIQLHSHVREVSVVWMTLRAFESSVSVSRKLLSRCVAEKPAALIELHKTRTVLKFRRQKRKQYLKQPIGQLTTINNDAMSIASTWN